MENITLTIIVVALGIAIALIFLIVAIVFSKKDPNNQALIGQIEELLDKKINICLEENIDAEQLKRQALNQSLKIAEEKLTAIEVARIDLLRKITEEEKVLSQHLSSGCYSLAEDSKNALDKMRAEEKSLSINAADARKELETLLNITN